MTQESKRQTANDFHPEVLKLFDQYVHGDLDRRTFLKSITKFVVGAASASSILGALSPQFALAEQIQPADSRIKTQYVELPSTSGYGTVRGYLARPINSDKPLPVVLVVHENRGLNPHIEDIARRLAVDQFIAFAPDALHPLGGYPGDEDKARALFQQLDQNKTRQDFINAVAALKTINGGNGRVGVVGFCYGGGIANYLATRLSDLKAAVSFYGAHAKAEEVASIKAPLLLHFAGADERINAGWPEYEAALKGAHVDYQAFIYPNVQHGFNNDTTPRYDVTAANTAWSRTIEFFNRHLRT
jgi:carboxymethylenebutenolidase